MSIYHEKHARVLLNLPHQLIVEKMVPELLVKYFILTRVDGLSGLDENEFFNPGLPQSSRPRGTRSRRSATDPPTSIYPELPRSYCQRALPLLGKSSYERSKWNM